MRLATRKELNVLQMKVASLSVAVDNLTRWRNQDHCVHCYCRSEPGIDWSIPAFPMQSLGAGNPKCCKCEAVDFTHRAVREEGKKK